MSATLGVTAETLTDEALTKLREITALLADGHGGNPSSAWYHDVSRLLATIAARDAEIERLQKVVEEGRAINAMLCHWYDEGMDLLHKAGIPDDDESPLADLADNMRSHLLCSDGYDFKKVRIFKSMKDRVAQLEAALRECEVDAIIRPKAFPVGQCGKCYTTEWLNGDLCHATTCVFGALTTERQ